MGMRIMLFLMKLVLNFRGQFEFVNLEHTYVMRACIIGCG